MLKPHTVLGLGLWLVAVRFIGIPLAWRNGLYVLTGIILIAIYLRHLWKETILKLAVEQSREGKTFVQNGGPSDMSRASVGEL